MKTTRLAAAFASLVVASAAATAAYAQTTPPPAATTSSQSSGNMPSSSGMSSDTISQKVKHELTEHGVTATNVDVSFQDGTATLTGTVFAKRDIKKAKSAAMRVRGVKHVDTSGLQVQSHHSQAPASAATS